MNVFDANLNYLPCYDDWNDLVLDFVFRRYINDQKSIFSRKSTFDPTRFLCQKRDGHSKRERMEIIDLHLKRVFVG